MTTTFLQLTSPLTLDQIRAAIYDAIEDSGARTASWKPGAVVRTMITGIAIVLTAMSVLISLIARSGFLTLSEGAWLTITARESFHTERLAGTYAAGYVTANNASGSIYDLGAGDLVLLNSATNVTYRNTEAVRIGTLETGVSVAVRAEELGSGGTATAGQIDALVTPLLGVTVSNPGTLRGTDPETDTALRARAMERSGSLSPNGPRDAYAYHARTAKRSNGTAVGVTRINLSPDGHGGVAVIVAGASGAIPGDAEDPETDLGAVAAAINANAVPDGITATTTSATTLAVAVEGTVWVYDTTTATDDEIKDAVALRLAARMSEIPIGGTIIAGAPGTLYVQGLEAAISQAVGTDNLIDLELTEPAADVDLSGGPYAATLGVPVLAVVRVASS